MPPRPAPPGTGRSARRAGWSAVLRCPAARSRVCWPAPPSRPGRAATAEIAQLRRGAHRRRRAAERHRALRAAARRSRTRCQGHPDVLRGRGHDLPRPLVLVRQARGPRSAPHAPGLPAAHARWRLQVSHADRQPAWRWARSSTPARRRWPRCSASPAGRSPSSRPRADARTASTSASGWTCRSCRGRSRSAPSARPTGTSRPRAPAPASENASDTDPPRPRRAPDQSARALGAGPSRSSPCRGASASC